MPESARYFLSVLDNTVKSLIFLSSLLRVCMSKRLVIAEKPSVAKDIADALGSCSSKEQGAWFENDEFVISYAVGHLLELNQPEKYKSEWKQWSLGNLPILPDEFEYSTRDSKAKKRVTVLRKLARRKDVTGVINACDAGREGEHIFRTILAELKQKKLPIERLWLNSLTARAIREGFENLKDGAEFDNLADAAACRSEADWLIGMNATRALTIRLRSLRYQGAWSAGRVQTPTLSMLVERELEILAHRPETYWQIEGEFQADDHVYKGTFHDTSKKSDEHPQRVFDEEFKKRLMTQLADGTAAKASEKRSISNEKAPLLFHLTDLQRAANSTLGFSSKRTLAAAQRLYEQHKLLSYPRTDSRFLPNDQRSEVNKVVGKLAKHKDYGPIVQEIKSKGMQNLGRIFNDKKVTDHHAIIPLDSPKPGQLQDDDYKIFNLVVRRTLAALMPPAKWARVRRTTIVSGPQDEMTFISTGRVLAEPGWQMAMGKEAGYGDPLAELKPSKNADVTLKQAKEEEKQTKPRGRLTEAGLLNRMENCGKEVEEAELSDAMSERGLGTPATRADTIERLITRGFVIRDGKSLRPTSKAMRMLDLLQRIDAGTLCSVALTGEMEYKLRQVEAGNLSRDEYMENIRNSTVSLTETLKDFDYDTLYNKEDVLGHTPNEQQLPVSENLWGYGTHNEEDQDAFFIFKDVRGHVITPQEMTEMLEREDHKTGPVTFVSVKGRKTYKYKGNLILHRLGDDEYDAGKVSKKGRRPSRFKIEVEMLDDEGNPVTNAVVNGQVEEVIKPLLTTKKGLEIVETNVRYIDKESLEKGGKPKAVLPKEVCERPMTPEEAAKYFTDGTTGVLSGFKSKKGRAFRAELIMQKSGRHGFEFPPRERRPKKSDETSKKTKSTDETKTEEKKTTKKASSKKSTESKTTKKTSTKKTTTKKTSSTTKTKKASSKKSTKDDDSGEAEAKKTKKASSKKSTESKTTKKTSTKKTTKKSSSSAAKPKKAATEKSSRTAAADNSELPRKFTLDSSSETGDSA